MPDRRFHFISGLPRSGSTLTAALLRQNPRFHAGMSSPVAALTEGLIAQVSAGTELSTMVSEAQRERLLRGLFESYHADRSEPVIFDTNRAWTAHPTMPARTRNSGQSAHGLDPGAFHARLRAAQKAEREALA